jgi:hypothetical protein
MMSINRQSFDSVEQQQPVYLLGENSRSYILMNNVPLTTNCGLAQEQQTVYVSAPVNYLPMSNL